MDNNKKLTKEKIAYLSNLFHNPKEATSYRSPYYIFKHVQKEKKYKITLLQIKKWLESQDTYTLFKETRTKKNDQSGRLIVEGLGFLDIDVAHMRYPEENKNYLILVAVDVFSSKTYGELIKNEQSYEIIRALASIIKQCKKETEVKVSTIRSDGAFSSKKFKEFLKKHEINHIIVRSSEHHASIAENKIKFLKKKLYSYLHQHDTHVWINIVDQIIKGMNKAVNLKTGFSPDEVTKKTSDLFWWKKYAPFKKEKKQKPPSKKKKNN